jgi:hypothetical protein
MALRHFLALLLLSSVVTVQSDVPTCRAALVNLRSSGCLPLEMNTNLPNISKMCHPRCTALIKEVGSACTGQPEIAKAVALINDICEPCPKSLANMIVTDCSTDLDSDRACGKCKIPICTVLSACPLSTMPLALWRVVHAGGYNLTEAEYQLYRNMFASKVASCPCAGASINAVAVKSIPGGLPIAPSVLHTAIADVLADALPDLWH